jgi:splicing factor 3A subunit 3
LSPSPLLQQTYEEMLAELEEAEGDAALDADDDEEEEYVYNPLKLPLGMHPQTLLF